MELLLDSLELNSAEGVQTDRIKIVIGLSSFIIEEYEGGLKVTKTSFGIDSMSVEPSYANQIKIKKC